MEICEPAAQDAPIARPARPRVGAIATPNPGGPVPSIPASPDSGRAPPQRRTGQIDTWPHGGLLGRVLSSP